MLTETDVLKGWNALGLGIQHLRQVDDDVIGFHGLAQTILQGEVNWAKKQITSVDPGLRPDVATNRKRALVELARARAEKQIGDTRKALLGKRVDVARELFDRRVQERRPKDPMEAMTFAMRVNDARAQLQGLSGGQRAQALAALAEAGDARLPDILQDSIVPLVTTREADAYLETWRVSTGGPSAEYLAASTAALEEAEEVTQAALTTAFHHAAAPLGVDVFSRTDPAALVDALDPTTKARFTATHGPDALAELAAGKRPLNELAELMA